MPTDLKTSMIRENTLTWVTFLAREFRYMIITINIRRAHSKDTSCIIIYSKYIQQFNSFRQTVSVKVKKYPIQDGFLTLF
jgi:hypothetical protein